MKLTRRLMLMLLAIMLLLPGCGDRVDLEDMTLVLMLGIDLDKDNNLVFYSSSPVFNKEAKKKNEESKVSAMTVRDSRNGLDARVSALINAGKVQNILLSKRILQHEGWFKLLDVYFRDSKTRINGRVIAVDGTLDEIMFFTPANKRRLPLYIAKLIKTAHERSITQETTLLELHRQMYDKGITPCLPQIQKNGEVQVLGTALLNKEGKYLTTLNLHENQLLQLLQDKIEGSLSYTIELPEESKPDIFSTGAMSFNVGHFKRKVNVTYAQDKFRFDVALELPVRLTERLFSYDVEKEGDKLEGMINKHLEEEMKELMRKIQKYKIDPIGLGLFARAYQYEAWKKVQYDWGKALSIAEVHIHIATTVKDMGEVK